MTSELNLSFHKSFDGYLAKINIPEDIVTKTRTGKQPDFILLLDRSGSMGQNVERIVNIIMPKVFAKLNYGPNDIIHIITYDTVAEYIPLCVSKLSTYYIRSRGSTNLCPGLDILENKVLPLLGDKIRFMHISDGAIWDQNLAIEKANGIAKIIKNNRQVNSQAVRYMTGGQPDTRGLSSTLQFNNVSINKLIDVNYANNENGYITVADMIIKQYLDDGLSYNIELSVDNDIIANDPWNTPLKTINLTIGSNTIWFKEMPDTMYIKGINGTVKPHLSDNISTYNVGSIIEDRLNYYMDRIRILKVVNSKDSTEEIKNILMYFEQFQKYLDLTDMKEDKTYTPDLKFRFLSIKKSIEQRRKSLFMKIQQLANDDMVSQLNSAQQADYLRGVEVSKNAKGLARRAMKTGFDLTDLVYNEVKNIHAHISELNDIDDSNHQKSFYSMETTLEGIKTLSQLVEDGILEDTNVFDIIQLSNIVGVAANHKIGDYPDAMAFRFHDIFPGTYISVSDITVYQTIASKPLIPPGFPDKEITNCVPVFDDERIHDFMRKYAPMLMNLVSGVGMRRVLADVPSTHLYTVCSGLWASINKFSSDRSEAMIQTIYQLAQCYQRDVGSYFDHNEAYLVDQDVNTSYFINNNGLTNMLNLLHRCYKKNNTKNMSKILRAIYCYEFYQSIKKPINKAEDKPKFVESTLVNLLGLDYEKYGTKVGDLFEDTPKPNHDTTYTVNNELLASLTDYFKYFKNLYLSALVFEAIEHDDYIMAMKQIPPIDDKLLLKTIEVEYTMEQFLLYSVVESVIYHTKQLRASDKTTMKMNCPDIGYHSEAEKMIKTYIFNYYQKSYNNCLRTKTGNEYKALINMMINKLTETDIDDFVNILKTGFQYKGRVAQIVNTGSQGFIELGESLCNIEIDVPDRFHKLWIYILGKTNNDDVVWNGGNAIRINLQPYESVFKHFDKEELWNILYKKFILSVKHLYRGNKSLANRHGHHNEKPSYWALGYKTVKDMSDKISKDEYDRYADIHDNCCGFSPISLYQRKKMARKERAKNGDNHLNYY